MAAVTDRRKELTRTIVVRIDEATYQALVADAERYGRTVAQSVRFILKQVPS